MLPPAARPTRHWPSQRTTASRADLLLCLHRVPAVLAAGPGGLGNADVDADADARAVTTLLWLPLPGLNAGVAGSPSLGAADEGPGFEQQAPAPLKLPWPEPLAEPAATPPTLDPGEVTGLLLPLQAPKLWHVKTLPADDPGPPVPATEPSPWEAAQAAAARAGPAPTLADAHRLATHTLGQPPLHLAALKACLRQGAANGWPLVRQAVDWALAVRRMARCQALIPLPRQRHRRATPPQLTLLLDRQAHSMRPLETDLDQLAQQLQRLVGRSALSVAVLPATGPGWKAQNGQNDWRPWHGEGEFVLGRRLPPHLPSQTPVLLVSDLGLGAKEHPSRRRRFVDWLPQLHHRGHPLLLMAPLPPGCAPAALAQAGPSARLLRWGAPNAQAHVHARPTRPAPARAQGLADLLALLALLGGADHLLLRLARQCHPEPTVATDATLDWELWNHPDVQAKGDRAQLLDPPTQTDTGPEAPTTPQQRHLAHVPQLPLAWLQALLPPLLTLLLDQPPACTHALCLRLQALRPDLVLLLSQAPGAPLARAWRYLREELPQGLEAAARHNSPQRHALERQAVLWVHQSPEALLLQDPATFRYLAQQMHAQSTAQGLNMPWPAALALQEATPSSRPQGWRCWTVHQQGSSLAVKYATAGAGQVLSDMLLQPLPHPPDLELLGPNGQHRHWQPQTKGETVLDLAGANEPVTLRFGARAQAVQVAPASRPSWAWGWEQRGGKLNVQVPSPWGPLPAFEWDGTPIHHLPSGWGQLPSQTAPGNYFDFGLDEYGLWMDMNLEVFGVGKRQLPKRLLGHLVQRFRYIPPGQFRMGSTPEERELAAQGNEDWLNWMQNEGPAHLVTLTEGFWLADTPCTQALWLAVVGGKNPSYFKDKLDHPVEHVSWDDVNQHFLPRLQSLLPAACEAGLPTEAQWEYACRAGSHSAYHWGDEPDTRRANMGDSPRETSPVKRYAPNAWGLYDLHGNVWEWCADDLRDYDAAPVVDPTGPAGVGDRVLRGGSWAFDAWLARSARRLANPPGFRSQGSGFRLCLRSRASPEGQGLVPGFLGAEPPEAVSWLLQSTGRGGAPTVAPAQPAPPRKKGR